MISRFILPLVIMAFVPIATPAQESSPDVIRPRIEAPYITGKIKLDGSGSDWKAIKKMGRGISFYKGDGHEGTPSRLGTTVERIITDEKDLRVDFWAAHDGVYLYFLGEAHDDFYEPFDRENVDNMCYQEDMLRIMIDSNNSMNANIPEPLPTQPGYEGFGYSTDGNIYGDWSDFNSTEVPKQRPPKGSAPDGKYWQAACKVKKLKAGWLYTYEERVLLAGWPGRNMEPLSPGGSYGFNVECCDADNGVKLEGYILWSSDGTTSDYNYENLWGKIDLAPISQKR
ncbi:MAG: hypothetical protein WCU00_11170 [Candidatus Latescibacterota bacterium]